MLLNTPSDKNAGNVVKLKGQWIDPATQRIIKQRLKGLKMKREKKDILNDVLGACSLVIVLAGFVNVYVLLSLIFGD